MGADVSVCAIRFGLKAALTIGAVFTIGAVSVVSAAGAVSTVGAVFADVSARFDLASLRAGGAVASLEKTANVSTFRWGRCREADSAPCPGRRLYSIPLLGISPTTTQQAALGTTYGTNPRLGILRCVARDAKPFHLHSDPPSSRKLKPQQHAPGPWLVGKRKYDALHRGRTRRKKEFIADALRELAIDACALARRTCGAGGQPLELLVELLRVERILEREGRTAVYNTSRNRHDGENQWENDG